VLACAEDAGLDVSRDCRAGICGQCKVKLVTGVVEMEVQDALTADDRKRGMILACQAKPRGPVSVDL
jgi:glycine betaine catabolism B